MHTPELLRRIDRDWRAACPTLDPTPMRRIIALRRAASILGQAVESVYAHSGLNSPAFDLLLTLRRSGPTEGLAPGELAALMAVAPASVTNRIDRLEARGLVVRDLDPHDRRSWRVRLTQAGHALINELLPLHVQNEARLLAALSEDEQALLEDLLVRLTHAAETARAADEGSQ
ncbi:DNA-binding MarR family transcriptional regulator [Deinobacterium chartae]|uniref:DNA-binding MarR family transcriptional regulator n=1 Tax=Deinobacterium chartae TaxID=521158 RepID=A0A841HZ20_9DEIO|nr:MarR family transcriptional regulator [Deinobacterium chartae]MBB6097460.1 DNA-binding MarR family transcriptional regulator [Deinobacterium chartae]